MAFKVQPGPTIVGPINGDQLVPGSVGATALAVGSVTANAIAADAITGKTITGGTINGSVYNGTDYIQNDAGTFYYSGTPAAGNLLASIAPAAGTDAYGNEYVAGVVVYNEAGAQFAEMTAGATLYGVIASGAPDTADAGRIYGTVVSGSFPAGILQLQSPAVATGAPDGATVGLYSGSTGHATGNLANPQVLIGDLENAAPTDGYLTGNWFCSTVPPGGVSTGGNALVTPALASGFTNDNLVWSQIAVGCVLWQGEFAMNSATSGAGAATIYTLPAGYRPKKEVIVPASWRTSSGLAKGAAFIAFETSGAVTLAWETATAAGDRFSCSAPFMIA